VAYRLNENNKYFKMKFRLFYSIAVLLFLGVIMSFVPSGNRKANESKAKDDNPYYIIVDKSEYELKVYDDEGWYATYPIVFGSKDLSDKMKEGDKRTPNGKFKVLLKKIHPKWGPELLLDYPNEESYQLFNDRKAKGLIPRNARIGNGIAIHATRPQEE